MVEDFRGDPLRVFETQYPPWFERAACTAIVQSVPHAILLLDQQSHIVLLNRAAATLFGRPAAALRGVSIAEFLSTEAVQAVLRDFTSRRVRVVETCLTSKSRTPSVCTIKITAAPLARTSRFMLLVIEDISDKAALEQQLVDSEAQSAMGQLAAG